MEKYRYKSFSHKLIPLILIIPLILTIASVILDINNAIHTGERFFPMTLIVTIIMGIVFWFTLKRVFTIYVNNDGIEFQQFSSRQTYSWSDIEKFNYHQLSRQSVLYFLKMKDNEKPFYFLTKNLKWVFKVKGSNRHPEMIQFILKNTPEKFFN